MKMNVCIFSTLLFLLSSLGHLTPAFTEDVKITTYYPSPYGSYKHLSVEDGATSSTSYGSLQIVRQENNHLGSHVAFMRDMGGFAPKVMGLGYKQSSDTFGFGPGVDMSAAFDPTKLSMDSSGKVGIGTSSPQAALDIVADGGAVLVPRKNDDATDPSGVNGMIYYNTTAGKFRIFEGGAWKDLSPPDPSVPDFDSGWVYDTSTANHQTRIDHLLGSHPRRIAIWFAPPWTGAPAGEPVIIYPKIFGWYYTGTGNPATIQITTQQVVLKIAGGYPLQGRFNETTGTWTTWSEGYWRVFCWE